MVAEHGIQPPQERIQLPQVVEQVLAGPMIPSRDRILQGTVEQISDVPVPEMVEQLVKLPKTVSEDRIQQRTVERIVDISVPQDVKDLVEVSEVFPKDRIQQRFAEQNAGLDALGERRLWSLCQKVVTTRLTRK